MYGKRGGMYGKRGGMYGKRGGMYGKRGVECGKRGGMVVWVPIMLLFFAWCNWICTNYRMKISKKCEHAFFNKFILYIKI